MSKNRLYRFLGFLCALAMVFSCVTVTTARAEGKKVTVMVYMCGSNLESKNAEGTRSLGQMIKSRFNKDEVNVVVLGGGTPAWSNGFATDKLTLGELGNGRQIAKTELPLSAMGDPDTLSSFLRTCADRYPADENILVFWNHGGGPAHGVCQDDLFGGDSLSLKEIAMALASSPYADHGLDVVAFNACLMGSAELSVVLAPFAKYLVATEDSMYGMTYDWLAGVENRTALETAKLIAEGTFAFNQEVIERQHAPEINSVSVVDLSKADSFCKAVDAFFTQVLPKLTKENFDAFSAGRRKAVTFGTGESGNASGFDLVDLGDLVKQYRDYAPAEAEALLSSIRDTVAACHSAKPECTGMTVYHPFENKREDLLMYRIAVYNDLGFSPAYTTYIQTFAAMLTGTRLAQWTGLRVSASAKKDQRSLYTMKLTEEQAAHFGKATLTAMAKTQDGTYVFTWSGDSSALNGTELSAQYVHNSACVTDAEGKVAFNPLPYTRDINGNYLIPAELTRHEKETEDGVLPEITQQGLISCAFDSETRKLLPGGVQVLDEVTGGYTPAFNMAFTDYDEIKISVPCRAETRDEDGVLLPFGQWTVSTTETFERAIDGSWDFALLPDLFDPADLYVAFEVADSQNNLYFSDLLSVETKPDVIDVLTEYDDANLIVLETLSLTVTNGNLILSLKPVNITETEAIVRLDNLAFNGKPCNYSVEGYGNGENWGLVTNESTILTCMMATDNLGGIDTLTEITFDLTLKNAAKPEENLGTVPVRVTMSPLDLTAAQ